MTIPGAPHDDDLADLYDHARAFLPAGAAWFDAHTHIGASDPDGLTATAPEIIAGLDRGEQERALVFPLHEPDGYAEANAAVLEAARASGGRLVALVRVDPGAPDALDEARRGLEAGAAGIKLHPRSDAFGLPHPVVDQLVALAAGSRGIVLFHAGRGIPCLGEAAVALARGNPEARIVLAHAGISDLGLLAGAAAELPNLLFDTAWWQVWDLLQLFATVPPGQILHASDMPYGGARFAGLSTLRTGRAVGLDADALAAVAGGQLGRLVAGEDPLDLGPAPGAPARPPRLEVQRAVAYLSAAAQQTFGGADPDEALALARLGCQQVDGDPVLARVDALAAEAQAARARSIPPEGDEATRWPGIYPILGAQMVAGTAACGVP